jgi:hypothetical protein
VRGGYLILVSAAVALPSLPAQAMGATFTPGRFIVSGAPLVTGGGTSVSVFARPKAIAVDGCRSSKVKVKAHGATVKLSVTLACGSLKGKLTGTAKGNRLKGRITIAGKSRSFTAKRTAEPGIVLKGKAKAHAVGVLPDEDAFPVQPATVFSPAKGGAVLRTEILVDLKSSATVKQVNHLLSVLGGRITGSLRGGLLIVVAVPDPGSLSALDALRKLAAKQPGVAATARSGRAAQDDLPNGFAAPLDSGSQQALHHLLELHMPAAWNAQAAMQSSQPLVLVEDLFGNGSFDPHVDATIVRTTSLSGGQSDNHGYHVVGTIAGDHDSDGSPAGRVTGVFPGTTRLDLVDLEQQGWTDPELMFSLAHELLVAETRDQHIVVNTSLHFDQSDPLIGQEGREWAQFIHDRGLEGRVLHATAAGNESTPSVAIGAERTSAWTYAALTQRFFNHVTPPLLTNTLVVESNGDNGDPGYAPTCRSGFSDSDGTISAVGENVYSDLLGTTAGLLSGTSMATPQIAGLAEYLWTIAPDLTAPQVKRAIEQNGDVLQPGGLCHDTPEANAYAATLSLDKPGAFSKANDPVRFAILDQNGDGVFDQADVQAFADHILTDTSPANPDWSRWDLNGDGFTGGDATAPFDLETAGSTRAGAPVLGTVFQTVHDTMGNPVQLQLDERHASDADILCYYAYSSLYTPAASNDQRDTILGDHCQPPVVIVGCSTEADSSASASIGATDQILSSNTPSQSIPKCSPALNLVLPDLNAHLTTPMGCGAQGKSPCNSKGVANGSMTASGSVGLSGGTLQARAQGSVNGSVTSANNSVGDANVNADASISFKITKTCQYSVTGTVTSSTSGGGTVAFSQVELNGPSGTILNESTSGGAQGTLDPGSYGMGVSGRPTGNTDPDNPTFGASFDATASITLTC